MQSSHFALYFLVSSFLARRGFTLDDYSIIDHPQNSFDLVSASEDDWARLPDVNPELIALEDKILHPRQVDTGLFDSYSQPAEDLLNPNLDNTWAILPDSGPDTLGSDNLFAEASPGQTDPYEISSQFGEDGANSDLDMAGCSATNHWGARDQSSVCPTSDLKIPELPTLDQFTGKLIPADERSQGLTNKLTLPDEQNTPGSPYLIDDGQACASGKPFRLCCICDGSFDFTFCQDCLKSKSQFNMSQDTRLADRLSK